MTGASLNSGGGGSTCPPVAMTKGTFFSRSLVATGQTFSPFKLTSRIARSKPPFSTSSRAHWTVSHVPRTLCPRESRKSSSIIAIRGSSSTIRIERAASITLRIRRVHRTAKCLFAPCLFGARGIASRFRELGHREWLGQEIHILDVDGLPELLFRIARHEQDLQLGPALTCFADHR